MFDISTPPFERFIERLSGRGETFHDCTNYYKLYKLPNKSKIADMRCSNCNSGERPAEKVRVKIDSKKIEMALCRTCRQAFEAEEWIRAAEAEAD